LRDALQELTPEHRTVILLREVEGLSYDEISEVLQCPRGTVMSRLHYARDRLRGILGDLDSK
jgi:RNA polymerase sigma-70 factor (ECF subfamily)